MNREEFLKQRIHDKFGNVRAFSESINIPYTTIRSILERGVGKAGVDNVIKICKGLDLSPELLYDMETIKTLSSLETIYNKLEPPRQEKVYHFAKEELKEQEDEVAPGISELEAYRQRKTKARQTNEIPCYGAIGAGLGEALHDENPEYIPFATSIIPPEADFCLLVNGDSMEPIFLNGTYIFINVVHGVHAGTVAVVILNGEGLLKRVWFENDFARLESFNRKYEDIIVTEQDDFRIIGKVVM